MGDEVRAIPRLVRFQVGVLYIAMALLALGALLAIGYGNPILLLGCGVAIAWAALLIRRLHREYPHT